MGVLSKVTESDEIRLLKAEEKFRNQLNRLEQAERQANLSNRDVQTIVRQVFDSTRDNFLQVLESMNGNSGDSTPSASSTGQDGQPPQESNLPQLSPQDDPIDVFIQLTGQSDKRDNPKPNAAAIAESSYESVRLDGGEGQSNPVTAEPKTGLYGQENLNRTVDTDNVGSGGGGGGGGNGGIFAILRRILQRVADFFEWLWNKIKEGCRKIRDAVRQAFHGIVNFFRRLFHGNDPHDSDQGTQGHASNPGLRESLLLPCQEQAYARHGYKYLA